MGLGKKGQPISLFGLFTYVAVLYVPMTLIVYFLLIQAHDDVLSARIYVGELDDAFLLERVFDRVSYTDINTGRIYPGVIEDPALFNESLIRNMFYFHPDKPTALNLTMGSKSIVLNPDYYEIARPLAPVRYRLISSQKEVTMLKDKNSTKMNIEIVSGKK